MTLSKYAQAIMMSALVAVGAGVAASPAMAKANTKKPNVLLFVTDDAGMDQNRLYGYDTNLPIPAPPTPNLKALQDIGLTFRNAWTMPACSTARGVLYTGRYPFRTHLEAALGPSDLANSMISPYLITIPKIMNKAGYATALFGKFHVGLQGNNPYGIAMVNALGWQHFDGWLDETGDPSSIDTTAGGVGAKGTYPNGYVPGTQTANGTPISYGADAGACYSANGQCEYLTNTIGSKNPAGRQCVAQGGILVPNAACDSKMPSNLNFQTLSAHYVSPLVIGDGKKAHAVPPTDKKARTYRNVEQTDAAIEWINKQQKRGKRWFATITTATVHTPLQVPPIDLLPEDSVDVNNADISTTVGADLVANQMIEAADREFGRLLTATGLAVKADGHMILTETGANTVFIYVNDNGSLGSQVRLPFDPYRAKGTAYQTGVWTPMIVAGAQVNPLHRGENVEALVNIADLYELIGNVAGVDVRKNNPYQIDSVPMIQYLADNQAEGLRKNDFNLVGPNIQPNNGMNGPCQFAGTSPPSCSQIPVTKGVCEDNGGTWFGVGGSGTYTTISAANPNATVSMSIPSDGFKYCCQVQKYIVDNGGLAGTVIPTTSLATRDVFGHKVVRNQWNNYSATAPDGCAAKIEDEYYIVGQTNPAQPLNPLLDTSDLQITNPTPEQQVAFDKLTVYMNEMVNSQFNCLAEGDGNNDGVVNLVDLANYKKMKKITAGSSWYDVNTDGKTNETDQQIITQHLGLNCKTQ